MLTFFRFNYQLLWEQQDQQAYINFPQILTQTELLPYIIKIENKHLQYRDLTSFNITYFEQINLDHTFLVEHSETTDNRPFITSDFSPGTTPEQLKNKPPMLMLNFYILDNIQNNQKTRRPCYPFPKSRTSPIIPTIPIITTSFRYPTSESF